MQEGPGLPRFEFLSVRDAHLELALKGSRGEILREYMGYIEQIDPEHAGKLTAAKRASRPPRSVVVWGRQRSSWGRAWR